MKTENDLIPCNDELNRLKELLEWRAALDYLKANKPAFDAYLQDVTRRLLEI